MKRLRIGNGSGFWGDNRDAPVHLAEQGQLDYLTLEYLAELTMSILALQKQRDPAAGYAADFLDVLERLAPILRGQPGLKIITNAGGMNPLGCAEKARAILRQAGMGARIVAAVAGDDLLPRLDELLAAGQPLTNLDTGRPLAEVRARVVSANAYLGAAPIVEALRRGASIVITGRVADAALTVAPAVHEFGWDWTDANRIAAANVAGHLIECGGSTGPKRPTSPASAIRSSRSTLTATSASPSPPAAAARSISKPSASNCSTRSATRRRISRPTASSISRA